ncbi:MAG: hypothetical protein E7653_02585 [Ruminococcaceae bacterium]|nr:hypothetical protein [Oscillospiraceae bacterium]
MGKIKSAMYRFMYGRNGADKLGNCLMIIYVVIVLLYTVLTLFIDNVFFDLISWLVAITLFVVIIWRMMSRKVAKRRLENEKFCNFFKLRKNKFKDRKTHVYRKCPACKATLRLPKAKGVHTVICPRCKHRFSVKG